jgi:hypothetical protein
MYVCMCVYIYTQTHIIPSSDYWVSIYLGLGMVRHLSSRLKPDGTGTTEP